MNSGIMYYFCYKSCRIMAFQVGSNTNKCSATKLQLGKPHVGFNINRGNPLLTVNGAPPVLNQVSPHLSTKAGSGPNASQGLSSFSYHNRYPQTVNISHHQLVRRRQLDVNLQRRHHHVGQSRSETNKTPRRKLQLGPCSICSFQHILQMISFAEHHTI